MKTLTKRLEEVSAVAGLNNKAKVYLELIIIEWLEEADKQGYCKLEKMKGVL